jgi:AraC-like DNA-binding protein
MSTQLVATQPTQLTDVNFDDIGDLGRSFGWEMDFRQLNPGPQFIPAAAVAGNHVAVIRMSLNRGYHQRACPPPGTITFGIPERGAEDWFGAPCPAQSILPFNLPSGVDMVSRRGFLAYTLSFAEGFLRDVAETCQLPVADVLVAPCSGAFIPDSQAVQKLRRLIRSYFHDDGPLLDNEQETALAIELLRAGWGEAAIVKSSTPVARRKALARALDYINECQGEVIAVGELCAATGISWRTLTRAFQERFGLGPKAYLNRLRLTAVRTNLSTAGGEIGIADIANRHGFWHMGQFARDYRLVYGELPSATLRRSAGLWPSQNSDRCE